MAERLPTTILSPAKSSHRTIHKDKSFFSSNRQLSTPRSSFDAAFGTLPSILQAPAVFSTPSSQDNAQPFLGSIEQSVIIRRRSITVDRARNITPTPLLESTEGLTTPPLRVSTILSPSPSPTPSPNPTRAENIHSRLLKLNAGLPKLNTTTEGPEVPTITLTPPQAHVLISSTNLPRNSISPTDGSSNFVKYMIYGAEITTVKLFDHQTFFTNMHALCSKSRYFAVFGPQNTTFKHTLHNVDPKLFRSVLDWVEQGTLSNLPDGVDPALRFLEDMDILASKLQMDGLRNDVQPVMECLRYESLKQHFYGHGGCSGQGMRSLSREGERRGKNKQKIAPVGDSDEGISMD